MSYKALVCRAKFIRPIEGADRINRATVNGYEVIIGKDVMEGTLGVFFEAGGNLSQQFALANDLIRRKDENGETAGGMFEPNCRVRAVRLRGVKSEGFWIPLNALEFTGYDLSRLKEGDQFHELNDIPICQKYETPAQCKARGSRSPGIAELPMFPRHPDTANLLRCVQDIPSGAIIYLTAKLHGTSGRFGYVRANVPIERPWWQQVVARLLQRPDFQWEWILLNGSRNVILDMSDNGGFHKTHAFRYKATKNLSLHRGEMIYFELVGYVDPTTPIMHPQATTNLRDKTVQRQFGDMMQYTYGCVPGETQMYVYRITLANEDGYAVDLSYPQMVYRCEQLGLKPVPLVAEPFIYDGDSERLTNLVNELVNGPSGLDAIPSRVDARHIEEGVVVRWETGRGISFAKCKSTLFGLLEGHLRDEETFVDLEEVS